MASEEIFDLRPNLVSFWGRTNCGEEEEEGKEKKKKKKKEEEEAKFKVWNYDYEHGI